MTSRRRVLVVTRLAVLFAVVLVLLLGRELLGHEALRDPLGLALDETEHGRVRLVGLGGVLDATQVVHLVLEHVRQLVDEGHLHVDGKVVAGRHVLRLLTLWQPHDDLLVVGAVVGEDALGAQRVLFGEHVRAAAEQPERPALGFGVGVRLTVVVGQLVGVAGDQLGEVLVVEEAHRHRVLVVVAGRAARRTR